MTSNSGLPPTNRPDNAGRSPNGGPSGPNAKPRRHVGSTADRIPTSPRIGPTPIPTPDPGAIIMPEALAKAKERAESAPRRRPQRNRDSISGSDGIISIQVRQETLVLFGLVVCSSLLGAFLFGHQVGRNRRIATAGRAAPAMIESQHNPLALTSRPARRSSANKTAAAKKPAEHWTLCAISYTITRRAKAEDMVKILSAALPNQKVFPKQRGDTLMVCVGYFNSYNDSTLKALRDVLRKMRYRGETPFKDCYAVKL